MQATSFYNQPNFSVRNTSSAAENEFYAVMEERAAMKRQVTTMLQELFKLDGETWARMWDYSRIHTLVDTHETLLHEFERIEALSEQDEITGLRAGM